MQMRRRIAPSSLLYDWSKNVSRETFSASIFLFFLVLSVLVALLGGWTIQPKCLGSAQQIELRGFDFAAVFFSQKSGFLYPFFHNKKRYVVALVFGSVKIFPSNSKVCKLSKSIKASASKRFLATDESPSTQR